MEYIWEIGFVGFTCPNENLRELFASIDADSSIDAGKTPSLFRIECQIFQGILALERGWAQLEAIDVK